MEYQYHQDVPMEYGEYSQNMSMVASPIAPMPNQTQYLTPEEFEALNKSVQLLRISQLRYIVQKFSIPASGNKTKLLSLVLSIFQSLRFDKVLIDILQEINKLLAQQSDPFANPLASVGVLEIVPPDPSFLSPPNPLYSQNDTSFIFGPVLAPTGQSKGNFQFAYAQTGVSVNVCFLFPAGNPQQFSFQADLNGFPIEISGDDPFPQPLDVTSLLNVGAQNILDVKMLQCAGPMMFCVREYKYNGLQNVVDTVCGRHVNLDQEVIYVASRNCEHPAPFQLMPYLSRAFGTGNWNCPVCGRQLDLQSLAAVEAPGREQEPGIFSTGVSGQPSGSMRRDSSNDIFGGGGQDPFISPFDWDNF